MVRDGNSRVVLLAERGTTGPKEGRYMISFEVTKEERDLIERIVDRAMKRFRVNDRMSLTMDVTACHANGCPLDLKGLLKAEDFDFSHDVGGIARHLDRTTGKLGDCFLPRTAQTKTKA